MPRLTLNYTLLRAFLSSYYVDYIIFSILHHFSVLLVLTEHYQYHSDSLVELAKKSGSSADPMRGRLVDLLGDRDLNRNDIIGGLTSG